MKLNSIQVEQAIEQSVAPVSPEMGPIEATLRQARAVLGADGEYWGKGNYQFELPLRLIPTKPGVLPSFALRTLCKIFMEYRELGPSIGYCTIGAMMRVRADPSEAACFFSTVNNIPFIPQWNDSRHRTWFEVAEAFDRAIAAAKVAGL